MNKFLYSGISFCLFILTESVCAQVCTPSLPGPYGAIVPDTTTNLPVANVGTAYNTAIQVYVPHDTLTPPLTSSVPVQDFKLTNITGLPAGFSYSCTPSNCTFPGGTAACVTIQGNAPTTALVGTYPLAIFITAHLMVLGFPIPYPDTIFAYRIKIVDNTGILVPEDLRLTSSQIIPSALESKTDLLINSPLTQSAVLSVYSVLGNLLYKKDFTLPSGQSQIAINSSEWNSGMYFYSLQTSGDFLSGKILVHSEK